MQQSTKQRIVGTVVLLALALIFLPIIFDGQGSYQAPISSRIPEPPEIVIMPEPVQSRPVILADSIPDIEDEAEAEPESPPVAVAAATATDSAPAATDVEEVAVVTSEPVFNREAPQLGADGLPEGWSVRLGSFADASNAETLMQRLQDAGYRAYTRRIESEQGSLTGVFVGPWVDRATVASYQNELQQHFQLAGIVVRYQVEPL